MLEDVNGLHCGREPVAQQSRSGLQQDQRIRFLGVALHHSRPTPAWVTAMMYLQLAEIEIDSRSRPLLAGAPLAARGHCLIRAPCWITVSAFVEFVLHI